MMNTPGIKSGFAWSRNPVILRNGALGEANSSNIDGTLEIIYAGTNIYEARFSLPLEMDIAEILDSYIEFFKEAPVDNKLPICQIEDSNEFDDRKFTAVLKLGDYVSEIDRFIIPGGISRQNFRQLNLLGKDIFQVRFFNHRSNFFFSTRTASWLIVMKETELYPLYFLPENTGDLISIVERTGGNVYDDDGFDRGVAVLDIAALRRYFAHKHNVLPSVFDVYYNSGYSCRIVVERSDVSKDRYRLKFRNSLGVFEIIELTGDLSITPDYSEAEDASFKRYDSITRAFYTDRKRVERRQSITVETGVKRPDEVRFFMDMIGSDEVYLLDLTPFPLKVIPSVEEFSYKPRPDTPEKFTLKLEISDSEINIMQEIIDGSEGIKPRVFSKQFSKQFN